MVGVSESSCDQTEDRLKGGTVWGYVYRRVGAVEGRKKVEKRLCLEKGR
jgi:hypothetical protein